MIQKLRWAVIIGAIAIVAVTLFVLPGLRIPAGIRAGQVAQQMCGCVFVAGRALDSCRLDLPEDLDRIRAETFESGRRVGVRAWRPGLAERRAFYSQEFGCTLR